MKTLIVYASTHHGNTEKVARAMAAAIGADLTDILKDGSPDAGGYDLVGLASGVYFHSFHKRVQEFAQGAAFRPGQKVFLASTCGVGYRDYGKGLGKALARQGVRVLGSFQCRGYDTYAIFGKLGGIAKGHPDGKDLARAEQFAREMRDKASEA